MEGKKERQVKITDPNYNAITEIYSTQFCVIDKITDNKFLNNNKFLFKYTIVAICKNGGLIAMCKTPHYMELGNKNPLLEYIIVMHQDGNKVYKIKNSELYNNKRQVVGLEFNNKEQLYAFCDDGEIYKIDILKLVAQRLDFTSSILNKEKILKVKAFEKGFFILTQSGTIFYLKDIKSRVDNPLEFIVSLRDNLKFKKFEDSDFLIIPSSDTNPEEELFVCNPNEEGIFVIKKNKELGTFTVQTKSQNYSDRSINAYYLTADSVETYNPKKNQVGDNKKPSIGQVSAMAISKSTEKIAFYVAKKKTIYILPSKIPNKGELKFKTYKFNIEHDELDDESEIKEKDKILNFKNKQLFFLNDNCIAICGGRWIVIINENGKTYVEDLHIDKNSKDKNDEDPYIYSKGISEVDGIRLVTTNEILLIRKMPNNLSKIFDIFNNNPMKQLLSSYEKYEAKDPFSNDELREIKEKLSSAIFSLLKMAGFLYWTENDKETTEKKELQNFFLKAANYGKSVFEKNEFNFNIFNRTCMNLRIINAFRNCQDKPRFLTLEEYENLDLDSDSILKKTMRQLNFKLAFKIAKFLGLPEKDIYLKYALKKIKKIDVEDSEEINKVYKELVPMLEKLENISYIDLAKKCFKYNKMNLGKKFLDNEKSSLVKIPQYLELKEWKKAVELAIISNDMTAINIVLDTIYKIEAKSLDSDSKINKVFINTLLNYSSLKIPVINYLKMNKKKDDLLSYLERKNDKEELFYLYLEEFFNSDKKDERENILDKIKSYKPENSSDKKFYEKYISDLESSLKFKKECIEKGIFSSNDTTNFDNSIYDCFEKALPTDLDWIKKENNKNFNLSKRKITIMRLKELFKENKIYEIDKLMEEGEKKLDISYAKVGSMFFEKGNKEKAYEYALKEKDENLLEDKAYLLIKLGKYEEAAETALKIKSTEKFDEIFNAIGAKVGKDVKRREEIQQIYLKRGE